MTKSEKYRELNADTKEVILKDIVLAGKIISVLGGEISLPAFSQMVYRNSQRLVKKSVLKTIASHLNTSTDKLIKNANIQNENNKAN